MKVSNTKLTKEQKSSRKTMLKHLEDQGGAIATVNGFTVAKVHKFPGSRMAGFAVAVCSELERKKRRKVGEFHALFRLFSGRNTLTLPQHIEAWDFAEFLSEMRDSHSQDVYMY